MSMSESNEFDITTPEKRHKALNSWLAMVPLPLALPVALVLDGISLLTSGANEKEIAEQRKVAIDIIRAGKENGVDEIEITMSQKAGVGLSSDVDGVPIEFIVGASGTMKLKVKYK
ncbi:hypothetical protein NIES298_19140 [Microcystis aeruginosa NIES-298]|jgi:hypothetical protein|uniref:Uncharacterized protein n=2 Tax=Microcystaceae TaxID=1890449 RepID=A0A2H6BV37_MICAE|nr:unknown protein [Microcystis aeruginosa NIES-298]GBE97666.1 hypothetical protein NIES298_19140 [Microcystis aeruginosa NIES-298]